MGSKESSEDWRLELGGDGAAEAARELVERHGLFLRRLAQLLVHDESSAQDLEQDTWRVALEARETLREPRAWLAATARRLASTKGRSERRRREREARVAALDAGVDPRQESPALDAGDLLQSALRELPDPYRQAVVARYLEGLAPREIAVRDGVALETVKSRLRRGLAQLRVDLDGRHGGERSAWCALLVTGLGIDGPPGLPVGSGSGSVSRTSSSGASVTPTAAPAPLLLGGLWTVAIVMKLQLVAFTLAAFSAALWFLNTEPAVTSDLAPTSTVAAQSAAADDELAALAQPGGAAERSLAKDEAPPAAVEAAATGTQELLVEVLDDKGRPAPGVRVEVAPAGHPFNLVGHTGSDGSLRRSWDSKTPTMEVDVVLRHGGLDLVGLQRLELRRGVTRELRVRVPIDDGSKFSVGRLLSIVLDDDEAARPRTSRSVPECAQLEDGKVAFRLFGLEEFKERISVMQGGQWAGSIDVPTPAALSGVVVDTTAQPIPGYAVTWARAGGSGVPLEPGETVLTDGEGRYRFECPPGKILCVAGPVDSDVVLEVEMGEGAVRTWDPIVSRGNDVMVHVAHGGDAGGDVDGMIFEARRDDGVARWVGRAITSDTGDAALLHWPDAAANLSLIAPEKIAAVPVLEIPGIRAGEVFEYEVPMDSAVTVLWVQLEANDAEPDMPSLASIRVRDASGRFGVGLLAPGLRGERSRVRLPGGTWPMELVWEHGAVTDLGHVLVAGDQAIDLGTVSPPMPAVLVLDKDRDRSARLEVFLETKAVDIRVYDSTEPLESLPADGRLRIPAGACLVRITAADGTQREERFKLTEGEVHEVSL